MLHLVVVSPKKKKRKKRNINNDLAVLPSHDRWHPRIPICGAQLRE